MSYSDASENFSIALAVCGVAAAIGWCMVSISSCTASRDSYGVEVQKAKERAELERSLSEHRVEAIVAWIQAQRDRSLVSGEPIQPIPPELLEIR